MTNLFSLPKDIYIEITSKCNMDCVFCPYGVLERKKENMLDENVLKVLNELKSYKDRGLEVPPVTFHCLGEPLMNPNLKKYMSFFDDNDIFYWTVSNGLLFSNNRCDELFSHKNLIKLELSVHTICDRTFSSLRGMKKFDFQKYILLIKNAVFNKTRIDNNIPIQLDVMYDKNLENGRIFNAFNKEEFRSFCQSMEQWAEELEEQFPEVKQRNKSYYKQRNKSVDFGEFVLYRNKDQIPENLFDDLSSKVNWISWEIFPKVFVTIKKFFFFTPNQPYLEQIIGDRGTVEIEDKINFSCPLADSLIILSNGDMTFCDLDYEGVLSCGNISNMSIEEALSSERRNQLIKDPSCFDYCRKCFGKKTVNWNIEFKG